MVDAFQKIDLGLGEVMEEIGAEIRRRVRDLDGLGPLRTREDGDVTHDFDSFSERLILEFFESTGMGFRFNSEESEPIDVGRDQDFTVVVDPLDGSSLLARGYPLASVAVCIVRSEDDSPVLSRILEVFTDVQYSAMGDRTTRNGRAVAPSARRDLSRAFLVSYSATAERMSSEEYGRICRNPPNLTLNYGGPLDIAKVGSGQCDLMVELHKGFPPRDYLPGLHFAQVAGAVAAQPNGEPVPYRSGEGERVRFLVAANRWLLDSAMLALGG